MTATKISSAVTYRASSAPERILRGNLWTPKALAPLIWLDPSDKSTLFQDAAGTVPVTADNDPIGLIKDKSGNGYHASQSTSAKRPKYRTGGGKPYIEFDGTQTFLATGSINATAYSAMSVTVGVYKADGTTRQCFEFSASVAANNGTFSHPSAATGPNDWTCGLSGSVTTVLATGTAGAPPTTTANSCLYNLSVTSNQALLRLNKIQVATSGATNAGVGTFGNFPLYIGARAGTSLFFLGRIYQFYIAPRTLTAVELDRSETFAMRKSGLV